MSTKLGDAIKNQKDDQSGGLNFRNKAKIQEEKRTARLQATITEREKQLITEKRGYQSESDFIRMVLLQYIDKTK